MDEETRREIASLAAETMALQSLLLNLLWQLNESGKVPAPIIEKAFDAAAEFATAVALRHGGKALPEQHPGTLRVIEELRAQFVKGK